MKKPSKTNIVPSAHFKLSKTLLSEVRSLIVETRTSVAQAVNFSLTMLHWEVGNRVRREILKEKRAGYGEAIVQTLSAQLEPEFGRGFGEKSLRRMLQFSEVFPDREIVATLSRQLGWSHIKEIIPLKDDLKRDFYAEMCRIERWSVRMLRAKIDGMLFERTALSKKPAALIRKELDTLRAEDKLTPDLVFRDPYVLDFLGLADTYSEADLEAAILREIERFLLELGAGFAFVARQKRITLDGDDYYIDLLFYHRPLRRLIVIELKLGEFKPADSGQVELYLRWLDRHDRQPGEDPPLAIIHVAEYLTELPPPDVLRQRLHEAVRVARARLEAASSEPTGKKNSIRRGR